MLRRIEATVNTSIIPAQILGVETAFPRQRYLTKWWRELQKENQSIEPNLLTNSLGILRDQDESDAFVDFLYDHLEEMERMFRRRRIAQPPDVVSNALKSLFRGLSEHKDCNCLPEHDVSVRLCLGTFRSNLEHSCDFDMFFSLENEWHEANVRIATSSAVESTSANTPAIGDPEAHEMRVKKLCQLMRQRKALDHLQLQVDEDSQLYELYSKKSILGINDKEAPFSLEDILKYYRELLMLSSPTKQILALMLGYAVLYLTRTPWLPPTWGPSNILFFNKTSGEMPLKPFIQTQLTHDANANTCDDKPDHQGNRMVHKCPQIAALGVMLIELHYATRIEDLVDNLTEDVPEDLDEDVTEDVPEDLAEHHAGSNTRTRFTDAQLVLAKDRSVLNKGSHYLYAAAKCLDPKVWEDESAKALDDQNLRTTIYQEVLRTAGSDHLWSARDTRGSSAPDSPVNRRPDIAAVPDETKARELAKAEYGPLLILKMSDREKSTEKTHPRGGFLVILAAVGDDGSTTQ
ncbi:hypothetical protein P170DRAFT_477298 [Aspergillus steynii IBT 23096]|uniref:DUF7580 domain-containing protein n=1 Tax=Aspergillus steynii IBT 23096 TaxID=1392250 RepID=A0A2I2G0L8_9EURO|nr:uncharacterized protein P170DRAFT_477298 [Aspergillus steynii IBT 23096]PLB46418.1 hypothetical protein P170DRAFT_477298 [Aspergillus steynii IBT 23096]